MKVLDLDMDYFMDKVVSGVAEGCCDRLDDEFSLSVWSKERVIDFLENNLGLSKEHKLKGRIVKGHNESLIFWKELISDGKLNIPFEVIHVDSHADLGLGYSSWAYICEELLYYDVADRQNHNKYVDCFGKETEEGIGDYLLFAIAYQWISKLTYCANPNGDKNDYLPDTLKNFHENAIWDKPVNNIIQLADNPSMERPDFWDDEVLKEYYFKYARKDPEVVMTIIPTIEDVKYNGDFDFVVMAQSPNYTPAGADFIMDVFREYIDEI